MKCENNLIVSAGLVDTGIERIRNSIFMKEKHCFCNPSRLSCFISIHNHLELITNCNECCSHCDIVALIGLVFTVLLQITNHADSTEKFRLQVSSTESFK